MVWCTNIVPTYLVIVHLYNCKQTIIKAKGNYLLCMYENAKVKVNHSALPRVKFTYKVIFPAPRMIIGSWTGYTISLDMLESSSFSSYIVSKSAIVWCRRCVLTKCSRIDDVKHGLVRVTEISERINVRNGKN